MKRILSARGTPLRLSVLVLVLIIHSPGVRVDASNTVVKLMVTSAFLEGTGCRRHRPKIKDGPNKRTIIVRTLQDVKVSAGGGRVEAARATVCLRRIVAARFGVSA